ncbi:hypothetical protein SPBR_07279 [Sporothrix brasiliensis 5110]|uniref:Uncharacterized protein n=1 Tax=Sporothrix brasiliensis 5110 TaxID=1398154 RepID=A0A0C2IWF0_9PEZI|nr:uncharacterized protein SPBR_07279 [Sporothrix brasiliensis 5110]KIH89317.1 hypothetical protein SPBR_07279 [Sporothrix brasiliensis 5110]
MAAPAHRSEPEPDDEERELARQILVLERKAKLRQRLRQLQEAEAAEEAKEAKEVRDSLAARAHARASNAVEPEDNHVMGRQPLPFQRQHQLLEEEEDDDDDKDPDKVPGALQTETALPLRPAPPAPGPQTQQGRPDFWSLSKFGLLACVDTAMGSSHAAQPPPTHAVGVALNAQFDPTFYVVRAADGGGGDDEWTLPAGHVLGVTCSYSLTALRRDAGPLLFQPGGGRRAVRVLELAVHIKVMFAGHAPRNVALRRGSPATRLARAAGGTAGTTGTTDTTDTTQTAGNDRARRVVLAPKPHATSLSQQSLWWTSVHDADSDGRIRGNRSRSGRLPQWTASSPREHRFELEMIMKKPPPKEATEGPSSPAKTKTKTITKTKTASASAPLPTGTGARADAKPVARGHIHLCIELLANVGDGEWLKVAHRKSERLTIRSGGSPNPDTWTPTPEGTV